MSRIPVSTQSPSHPRTLQEPVSFPSERAVSPAPPSRHNLHSSPMSSLSGHASSTAGKKLSKRALGDEVITCIIFLSETCGRCLSERYASYWRCSDVFPSLRISVSLFWGLMSNNRHCAEGLSMNSPASEPFQLLSKVVADAEANRTLPKAPWRRSNPAPRLQFQIPSPLRKQVSSVRQRGQTAF
jgi:hypothetical protein